MTAADLLALTCIPLAHPCVARSTRYPFPGLTHCEIYAGMFHAPNVADLGGWD